MAHEGEQTFKVPHMDNCNVFNVDIKDWTFINCILVLYCLCIFSTALCT